MFSHSTSLTGKVWQVSQDAERLIQAIEQRYGVSPIVAKVLVDRGETLESARLFLEPRLKEIMPDPEHLKDMGLAVARLVSAIEAKEKIVVFADYDVDGATSSAIIRRYLDDCGCATHLYIPDRIDEGYGPSAPAMDRLAQAGFQVMVMLDCGTTSDEPLALAKKLGMDVIVVDHHTAQAHLPECYALVNPNRLDETSPLKDLCTAGLAFLLIAALHRQLRRQNWFADRVEPDLRQYLDLVALGTVCDVMPLTGLNRAFVSQGLKVMGMRGNLGLNALGEVAGLDDKPSAYHLGFVLGPRINAGGRVGQADLGGTLLATRDPIQAREIAQKLNYHNAQRQTIESIVLDQAMTQLTQKNRLNDPILLVAHEDWHPGVVGIVASRLKERFQRPACVISLKDQIGKGSGRSIPGLHLGQLMLQAVARELLIHGGGHGMAAGFTVKEDQIQAFHHFLNQEAVKKTATYVPEIQIAGLLSVSGCTFALAQELQILEPFGSANPAPRFALTHVRLGYAERFGIDHVRATFVDEAQQSLRVVAFRQAETPLGQFLLSRPQHFFHATGTLKPDTWNGRQNVNFILEDIMVAE